MAYGNRGGCCVCAGLLACVATVVLAETNTNLRSRDDKSAIVNLAVQAVQQVQAQEQANLHAVHEARQELASLRRLTLLVGGALGAGMLVLVLYARALLRSTCQRPLPILPHVSTEKLLRQAGGF